MISIKNIGSENTTGFKIIVLWIFSIQGMYQEIKGGHLSFGGCIGPIGISFNLHMYDTMLP